MSLDRVTRVARRARAAAFLRDHRDELFDASQQELAEMYRDTGAGKDPLPPALPAMASVLQDYLGASDARLPSRTWRRSRANSKAPEG